MCAFVGGVEELDVAETRSCERGDDVDKPTVSDHGGHRARADFDKGCGGVVDAAAIEDISSSSIL